MIRRRPALGLAAVLALAATLLSCGLVVSFGSYDTSRGAVLLYAVRGTVDGLERDDQVRLSLNGTAFTLTAQGQFAFPPLLTDGQSFFVSVVDSPPGYPCSVTSGAGTIAGSDFTAVEIHCGLSSDATLSTLVTSAGTLRPTFARELETYAAGPVPDAAAFGPLTTVTVTATAREAGAQIRIAGVAATSGKASMPIPIEPGPTPVEIVVTAADGHTVKAYTLVVSGAASIAYVKASNTRAIGLFGTSVALSEDTLAVGSPGEASAASGVNGDQSEGANSAGAGAVYVFTRTNGVWSQQAYLKASNTHRAGFGTSLALSGNTLAVGAEYEASAGRGVNGDQADRSAVRAGAVYIFTRTAGAWSQQAYIKASNPRSNAAFGCSVALSPSGDTLAVGASGETSNATGVDGDESNTSALSAGAAYVFTRAGAQWSQRAYIKASNTREEARFGTAVALAGNALAVGSPGESSSARGVDGDQSDAKSAEVGAVYIFTLTGATWSQAAYIKPSNTVLFRSYGFGSSVALTIDTLAVGAIAESSNGTGVNGDGTNTSARESGAVYVFTRAGAEKWAPHAYLKASNSHSGTRFGTSVALYGDTLAAGATGDSSSATGVNGDATSMAASGSGAGYVFRRTGAAWSQRAFVKATNTRADSLRLSANLGASVALTRDGLALGAPNESSGATGVNGDQSDRSADRAGAVYVLR